MVLTDVGDVFTGRRPPSGGDRRIGLRRLVGGAPPQHAGGSVAVVDRTTHHLFQPLLTLTSNFRAIDPGDARIVLVDAVDQVLGQFSPACRPPRSAAGRLSSQALSSTTGARCRCSTEAGSEALGGHGWTRQPVAAASASQTMAIRWGPSRVIRSVQREPRIGSRLSRVSAHADGIPSRPSSGTSWECRARSGWPGPRGNG